MHGTQRKQKESESKKGRKRSRGAQLAVVFGFNSLSPLSSTCSTQRFLRTKGVCSVVGAFIGYQQRMWCWDQLHGQCCCSYCSQRDVRHDIALVIVVCNASAVYGVRVFDVVILF